MSQNDSHIIVHNYIESNSNIQFLTIVYFAVFATIILLLLVIAIAVLIVLLYRKNKEIRPLDHTRGTLKESTSHTLPKNTRGGSFPQTGADNPAVIMDDTETDINSNLQHIPMSILKTRLTDQFVDSPESTNSAIGTLFPSLQEEELVPEPQPSMSFAGRVFAATKRKATNSKVESKTSEQERKPSSVIEPSSSLEWDYFESRPYFASETSEAIEKNTVDVCWV